MMNPVVTQLFRELSQEVFAGLDEKLRLPRAVEECLQHTAALLERHDVTPSGQTYGALLEREGALGVDVAALSQAADYLMTTAEPELGSFILMSGAYEPATNLFDVSDYIPHVAALSSDGQSALWRALIYHVLLLQRALFLTAGCRYVGAWGDVWTSRGERARARPALDPLFAAQHAFDAHDRDYTWDVVENVLHVEGSHVRRSSLQSLLTHHPIRI